MDLVEFLLARIAEDETVARSSMPGPWTLMEDRGHGGTLTSIWSSGGGYGITEAVINGPTAEHIARWDPARVLAECDAKRLLIEIDGRQAKDKGILAALALPYADHPDYDPEWRP